MMLKVSLTTRADRNYSGDSYTVSHDNLEKGIYVEQLFPDVRWESGEIGLSYACCEVSITFIP